jgi:hypothetical protein
MTYYDALSGKVELSVQSLAERRTALINKVKHYLPNNQPVSNEEDKSRVSLKWVTANDPRRLFHIPIQVLPVLLLGEAAGEDREVTAFEIIGKPPSGEPRLLGSMDFSKAASFDTLPILSLNMDEQDLVQVSWHSNDAELFLTVAETAFNQQLYPSF